MFPLWEVFIYEEIKGIISRVSDFFLKKQNKFILWRFKEKVFTYNTLNYWEVDYYEDFDIYLKYTLVFKILNPFDGINLYKRKEKSLWDYLANIAALGTTIFNGLCKIFGLLYSKNFDNYKIIERILSKEIKKVKKIELNDNNNIKENNLSDCF